MTDAIAISPNAIATLADELGIERDSITVTTCDDGALMIVWPAQPTATDTTDGNMISVKISNPMKPNRAIRPAASTQAAFHNKNIRRRQGR